MPGHDVVIPLLVSQPAKPQGSKPEAATWRIQRDFERVGFRDLGFRI